MRLYPFALLVITLISFGCSDPSSVGSGLIGNENLQIEFTDDVPINATTILGDTVFIQTSPLVSIGSIDGPIFGKTVNTLYASTSFGDAVPDFTDAALDSVVLRIPLDASILYGDSSVAHHVEVFQLDENFGKEVAELGLAELNSKVSFPFSESNLLGEKTFVPKYQDTVLIQGHTIQDTVFRSFPQLRIRIDQQFGEDIISMPEQLVNDTTYQNFAKGFAIRSTPQGNSMLGLNFSTRANHKLLFYYTKTDDVRRIYEFDVAGFSHLHVDHEHDGSGSEVESYLNSTAVDHELLFLESYDGTNIQLDLSGLKDFATDDKIINHAEIFLKVADVDNYDIEIYPPVTNMLLSTLDDDGDLSVISDIELATGSVENLVTAFGGSLTIDGTTGERTYRLNITNHVIDLLNDPDDSDFNVIVTSFFRQTTPNRTIIQGNNSDETGPILRLVVTEK